MQILVLVFIIIQCPFCAVLSACPSSYPSLVQSSPQSHIADVPTKRPQGYSDKICTGSIRDQKEILILDVDGTLYGDSCGIETEIKNRCHLYSESRFDCSAATCEEMHKSVGSSVIGLSDLTERGRQLGRAHVFREYYNTVYPDLKMESLSQYNGCFNTFGPCLTGYGGSPLTHKIRRGLRSLEKISSLGFPIVIASNSPVFHVRRVLNRIGLAKLPIAAIITPERNGCVMKNEAIFWSALLRLYPAPEYRCTLVDDNRLNLQLVDSLSIRPLRICEPFHTLDICLQSFLVDRPQWLQPPPAQRYLRAKNEVDAQSFNPAVQTELQTLLSQKLARAFSLGVPQLVVSDIGSGLLSLLPQLAEIISSAAMSAVATLTGSVGDDDKSTMRSRLRSLQVRYMAWETNADLLQPNLEKLQELGFTRLNEMDKNVHVFGGLFHDLNITIQLLQEDFMDSKVTLTTEEFGPDSLLLIAGACISDLIQPDLFISRLVDWSMERREGAILYLPITFTGGNRISIGQPELDSVGEAVLDSYGRCLRDQGQHFDAAARELKDALRSHGGRLSASCDSDEPSSSSSRSDWKISRRNHPYMWRCMTHFLAAAGTFLDAQLLERVALTDLRDWVAKISLPMTEDDRIQDSGSDTIGDELEWVVSNEDLLAELPSIEQHIAAVTYPNASAEPDSLLLHFAPDTKSQLLATAATTTPTLPTPSATPTYRPPTSSPTVSSEPLSQSSSPVVDRRLSLEFQGNRSLKVVLEPVPPASSLLAGQVLVRTHCCMVSTGTELKVFRGDLDSAGEDADQPLDLTIKGMSGGAGSTSQYPVRYGYSLVGTVVAEGRSDGEGCVSTVGRRVFAFCPHSSHAIVDKSDLLFIPDDLTFEDAVFLPAMETAVSLVMSAGALIGEQVAVLGQGLIGLLTAAVLQQSSYSDVDLPCITAVDVNPVRLAAARQFLSSVHGAGSGVRFCSRIQEADLGQGEGADVVVEVTGSSQGLQAALDGTRRGGKIVIGSWYSPNPNPNLPPLRLGTRFHRSAISMVASQVSFIPANLRDRWDKQRRFDLTWRMLSRIRPSRLLSSVRLPTSELDTRENDVAQLDDEDGLVRLYSKLERGDIITALICNPNRL